MVATVLVYEATGGTPGSPGAKNRVDGQATNDGTDVRFCTADAFNDVAAHPCIIPTLGAGDNYSYWKHLYLNMSGTYTTLNNIRFYTDGTIGWTCGTGGGLFVGKRAAGDNGCPMDASYDPAEGTAGTTGDWMDDGTDGHTYYKDEAVVPVDASTYTSVSPLTVDSADYGPDATDDSDAVVLQVVLADDATQGTQTDETLTFVYDEI